jgi:ABC-2 type transport system ATP-binding protein
MDIPVGGTLFWTLIGLGVVVAGIAIGLLWDLSRHDVQHLPKWAWAAIIVLVSFPIGPVLYLTLGRVAHGQQPSASTTPPAPRQARPIGQHPGAVSGSTATLDRPPTSAWRSGPPPSAPVIATTSLTKIYGDTVALSGVDLAVPRGATYGLIGPNGAGKTTMLSILAGLRHATSGDIHLDVDRRRIAVLVDTPMFEPWLTAREVVDLARHLVAPDLPTSNVDTALAEVGLTDAADRRTGGFSRGMLQRLGLATCLVGEPDVFVFDEPSSALDPAGRREVLDLIGRLAHSTTVVISTHILADVQQVCDMVGVIDEGHLRYQGPIADLLSRTSAAYTIHVRGSADGLRNRLVDEPSISDVEEVAPGRYRLVTDDAPDVEFALPRILAELGLALVAFNPATDLETAFLELTQ